MKKIVIAICLVFLTACTTNINSNKATLKKEKTFLGYITDESNDMVLLLNTETNITTVNSLYKDELINTAKEEIIRCHKLLDSHHYYLDDNNQRINNIKVLNDNIDNGPITVDPIIIDALIEAIDLTSLTRGYFNITLGELSLLYKDKLLPFDSTNTDPSEEDINSKLDGIINKDVIDQYIIIDKENSTIELKSNNNSYELDLGAFSKGYIINRVYNELIKYNTSFLLTAGSSSIVTYTNSEENVTWNVGIKNPELIGDNLFAFNLNNGAISTSGDYENYYFLEDGTRRHHILNPYTGYSENYYHSNTLISDDAGVIDALSTALFSINDKEERLQIINDIEKNYNIKVKYCFVKDNNETIMNQDFKDTLIRNESLDKIESITIE